MELLQQRVGELTDLVVLVEVQAGVGINGSHDILRGACNAVQEIV